MPESISDMDVIRLIHLLSARLERQCDQILMERYGIGYTQYKIMDYIGTDRSFKQSEIAAGLGQTEAGISRQIKKMFSMGLLKSSRSAVDRRDKKAALTLKGATLLEESNQVLEAFVTTRFLSLKPRAKANLKARLQFLAETYGDS